MATFDVSLVTPDGPVFEGEVEMLIVPGAAGEIGVLARHAPLIAMLKAGSTRVHVKRDGEVHEFATGPGFFKVEQDRALALVDDAVNAREIDEDRARKQLEEATQADLEDFLGDILRRRSANTAATRDKVLRVLYRWLEEEEELPNPMTPHPI